MLKSIVIISLALVVLTYAEPPPEGHGGGGGIVHHHGQKGHSSSQYQVQGGQGQYGNVKIRQSGPSKIFGWISRFAKIPHYLPRFPQFPKHAQQSSHKLPHYQAIILPDPPKAGGSNYYGGSSKGQIPESVKISQVLDDSSSYLESYPSGQEIVDTSYSPAPVGSVDAYSVPESAPQIEVVPSTLLYHNKQVYSSQPQAAAPIVAPPLQQQQQYNVINDYRNNAASYQSVNAIPAVTGKKQVAPLKVAATNIPFVPQSTGPDYFDTAYRGSGNAYQQQQQQGYRPQVYQQQRPQVLQGLGTPENNYGATFEIQSHGTPQIYDSSVNLGAIGGPVISSTVQQAYAQQQSQPQQQYAAPQQQQPQQGTHYTNPSAGQNIQDYANQALNNQALSSLIAAIPDAPQTNQQANVYADYSQLAQAASEQQPQQVQQQQQQQQQQQIPGVQILSQGTDGGNPVFEVIADHNAPQYEGGHPFDINKLISMIEPGAQLESAELSHAASESKTTYSFPAPGQQQQQQSSSSTSGITDLLLSESDPSPSLSKVDGSKFTRQLLKNNNPFLNLNVKSSTTNTKKNSSSSLKEIMDFFQQTGGKGYIVVEKKRHQPDNLTLDSDPNGDDDLTNGPTRVNITSESFLPQLELLNDNNNNKQINNNRPNDTSTPYYDNDTSEDDRDLLLSIANNSNNSSDEGQQQFDKDDTTYDYDEDYYDVRLPELSQGQDDKNVKNSVKLNLVVPPPPPPSPSSTPSSSTLSPPDKQKKTEQTNYQSSTTSSSGSSSRNRNKNIGKTTPTSITKKTTTTVRPTTDRTKVTTQKSQLTTLFEPVTSGKPVVFTTTPEPFLLKNSNNNNQTTTTSTTSSTNLYHPNHNYFANPPSTHSPTNSNYPLLSKIIPGSVPTINPFLDTVDESVLDDPMSSSDMGDLEEEEEEGDLSASESQQVRSIAITVTPPPKHTFTTTTPATATTTGSSKNSKASKSNKGTITSSSSSSSSSNNNEGGATATTTDKPVSTSTLSSSIVAPVTKKTSLSGNKNRPAPVYVRKP